MFGPWLREFIALMIRDAPRTPGVWMAEAAKARWRSTWPPGGAAPHRKRLAHLRDRQADFEVMAKAGARSEGLYARLPQGFHMPGSLSGKKS